MIWCFSFSFEEENLHSFPSFFLLFPAGYERVMNGVFIGLILPNYTLAPILSFSLQFESRSLCLYIFLFNFLIITFIYHVYNNIVIYSLLYFFLRILQIRLEIIFFPHYILWFYHSTLFKKLFCGYLHILFYQFVSVSLPKPWVLQTVLFCV
jgi:hypothetical protein